MSKPREALFWSLADKNGPVIYPHLGPCWVWTKSTRNSNHNGPFYGKFRFAGRTDYTHRQAWRFVHGAIPEGLHVCHHCDNPPCVNPDHLFVGTAKDNIRDRDAKGRGYWQRPDAKFAPRERLTHCHRGHDLSQTRNQSDRCGECQRLWWHENKRRLGFKGTGRPGPGRQATCQRGHEFSEHNTYVYANGQRACKACVHLRYLARRQAA